MAVVWMPKVPDADDPRPGWYKCEICGELGFDKPLCPKCGDGLKHAKPEPDFEALWKKMRKEGAGLTWSQEQYIKQFVKELLR